MTGNHYEKIWSKIKIFKKSNMIVKCTKNRKKTVTNYIKEKERDITTILVNLNDNGRFWKTVKPFLSNEGCYISKINVVRKDKIISDGLILAETFNKFFEKLFFKKLNVSRKGTFKNISPKCLLEILDVFGPILQNKWNEGILKDCPYSDKIKLAVFSPVHKK